MLESKYHIQCAIFIREKNNKMLENVKTLYYYFRLYAAGAQPAVSKLYRPLSYPVGRGTPMLNSLVGWDHSDRFIVPRFGMDCKLFLPEN